MHEVIRAKPLSIDTENKEEETKQNKSRKKEENSTVKRPWKEKRDGNTCSVCVNRKYQRTVWCQVRKNQQPTRVISSLGKVIGAETSCCSARAIYSRLEAASCFACVISCAMPLPYKYGWLVVLPFSSTFFFPHALHNFRQRPPICPLCSGVPRQTSISSVVSGVFAYCPP